jgi:hypothetical protein
VQVAQPLPRSKLNRHKERSRSLSLPPKLVRERVTGRQRMRQPRRRRATLPQVRRTRMNKPPLLLRHLLRRMPLLEQLPLELQQLPPDAHARWLDGEDLILRLEG